ncbi:GGDEF domain-containing protein [Bacillus norwichensis]|uniref:GGDEF domain-containing protein n=1 Tax=Bacillus norwichensis TaxID=2762217 RepID=A0ABR8VMK5_9BACI|nr:GGDEF domain-containing protein [Bacillus norwichensis]MBD8005947.1 GGDEF domain-containing protein [Bacillus norwichensis]
MNKNFRLHLTLIMIAFSIFISLVVALINQEKIRNKLFQEHELKLSLIEDNILSSLHSIDKAYMLFDKDMAEMMEDYSEELISLYKKNPDFEKWDFKRLNEKYKMDVYILNDQNVVTYSSVHDDIGLDFGACCVNFSNLLDQRRNEGKFSHDGMDISMHSGEIKKFSYIPTPDNKYIIELGVSLENGEIFKHFNFLAVEKELDERFSMVESIKVYNSGGFILGSAKKEEEDLRNSQDKWETFRKALKSGKVKETEQEIDGKKITYHYVPYKAEERRGYSTSRVVEIAYNKDELNKALNQSLKELIIQLSVIFIAAIVISWIIAQRVARPMYLAFHDLLTGLNNRAAFEELVKEYLDKKKSNLALMMIDLDNFKMVNDSLGHTEGDEILKAAAQEILISAGKDNHAARLGGDEFVVIFQDIGEDELKEAASMLIKRMQRQFQEIYEKNQIDISISVGIAIANDGDDVDSLYNKADRALYESKKKGKNQFNIYQKSS